MVVQRLKTIKAYEALQQVTLIEVQGGFAARAFVVKTADDRYFLKMYEKSRAATARNTANIADYTAVLATLAGACLKGCVPVTIYTKDGRPFCEDDQGKYLLYHYIEGHTIKDTPLTEGQTATLGRMVGKLHCHRPLPALPDGMIERFELPFNDCLQEWLENNEKTFSFLSPYEEQLHQLVKETARYATLAKAQPDPFVLCHTDIHGWNLMQSDHGLILIDWEGVKLAPKEADLFSLQGLPWQKAFDKAYQSHQSHPINPITLQFYHLRRKSEDIWDYIEQLIQEEQTTTERQETIEALLQECAQVLSVLERKDGD